VYRATVLATPRTHHLLAVAAGGVALPLLLAACSSSSTASTTTTRAQARNASPSVCTLVPPSEIQSILGRSVGRPVVANSAVSTTCTYPSTDKTRKSDVVIIGFRAGVTPAVAGSEQALVRRLHGTTTDVSGTGDIAYYYGVSAGGQQLTTLVTLVGTTQVTVTSTAPIDKTEALAQQIFATFAAQATTTTTTTTTTATG